MGVEMNKRYSRSSLGIGHLNLSRPKRSQVTIFIIVAILIIVSIVAVFIFFGKSYIEPSKAKNPQQFIEGCVKEAINPSIRAVLAGGGRIQPELFKMYYGEVYNYLCYQKNYYLTCINSHPQLKEIIENEILQDSEARVEECFQKLSEEFGNGRYGVGVGELDWDVELAPGIIEININKKIDISIGDGSQSLSEFNIRILSSLFDLAMVAREIVNQEAQYCNFEYNGFMLLYPRYDIKRIDYDESKIYKIKDRQSTEEFKFAIRSCAFPPGL